jgi:tetratricopeptide (TPR) repeat protein
MEAGDFGNARASMKEFRAAFPNSATVEETLFLFGRALAKKGRAAEARAVFEDFLKSYPGSALLPEVRLAEARALGAEGNWEGALAMHEQWLATHTNHLLRAEVEFQRALALDKVNQRTNALMVFTNFVVHFPTNTLAIAAQNWVADYYYDQEQWRTAEQNYQRVFQNTNWIGDPLTYRAQMMAARTAFRREGYDDARAYLTNLINAAQNDPKCPSNLAAEAWFELGDVFLSEPITGSTNGLYNFLEAAKVFDVIIKQFPSNKLSVLAWGKKGDCLFQIASYPNYAPSYLEATNAYQMVLDSKLPDVPVSARNQAEVGIGLVLKKLSEGKAPAEAQPLLRAAQDHFLNVVYGKNLNGQPPDPYYLKQAGLEAGRVTRLLGESDAAFQLYRHLIEKAPSLKTFWEARIVALQQQLATDGTP